MNCLGFYNRQQYNTSGPQLNTDQSNGSSPNPPLGDAYIYNTSNVGITTQGLIPVFDGSNQAATAVSESIRQTNLGITISNLQVNDDVSTSATTSLNTFITNVAQVINNAFNVNVNV